MSRIKTANGWMDYRKVSEMQISIYDIAQSLSRLTRFLGHGRFVTTVAEHSVLVSRILEHEGHGDLAMQGLLHDAAEAYMADIPAPLKRLPELAEYRKLEDEVLARALTTFGEDPELHSLVHRVDKMATESEALALFGPEEASWAVNPYPLHDAGLAILGLSANDARVEFLHRFWEIA